MKFVEQKISCMRVYRAVQKKMLRVFNGISPARTKLRRMGIRCRFATEVGGFGTNFDICNCKTLNSLKVNLSYLVFLALVFLTKPSFLSRELFCDAFTFFLVLPTSFVFDGIFFFKFFDVDLLLPFLPFGECFEVVDLALLFTCFFFTI